MQTFLIVIHLIVVISMIGLVMLQKSEGGGLGMGGGGGFMTSRGSSNVLSRSTAILAGVFFLTSLSLGILAGLHRQPVRILPTGPEAPVSQPGVPTPPLGGAGGVFDQLQGPAAPAEPQVPRSQ